jgi:hypothetical protein
MTLQEKKAVLDEMRQTPLSVAALQEIEEFKKMSHEQQLVHLNTTGESMSKELKQIQDLLNGKIVTAIVS